MKKDTESKNTLFNEDLEKLLQEAKSERNVVAYEHIGDFFKNIELSEDEYDKIITSLEENNVDVIKTSDDIDEDAAVDELEQIEEDEELNREIRSLDLSVPEGVSVDDPVRMYLKEKERFLYASLIPLSLEISLPIPLSVILL